LCHAPVAARGLLAFLGGRYVQYGEFLADQADVPVAFVEAALDGDDTVRCQLVLDQGVGGGEEQDLHLAVAVCEADHCPCLALLGRLALDVGDEAGEFDDAFAATGRGEFGDGVDRWRDRMCSVPSKGCAETYMPSMYRSAARSCCGATPCRRR
jgi:hypothetical protein